MTAPTVDTEALVHESRQYSYSDLRRVFADVMRERGEWAGCPIPIDGLGLVVEPSYPFADVATLANENAERVDASYYVTNTTRDEELDQPMTIINSWQSRRTHRNVVLFRCGDGPVRAAFSPESRAASLLGLMINSMKATWVHDIDAEYKAIMALGEHLSHEKFRYYMLLGYFLETSKRSGVTYLFRRARPTIAFRQVPGTGSVNILAALCQHPIAYYARTFVGSMTPTDDVIAHLLLMRADEHMFWKRSNQHPIYSPAAGL